MKGLISGIKRMEIHDGDGLRTTVFFKGCPLRCVWCHNPESISPKPQVARFDSKCIACGACERVCPSGAMSVNAFDPSKCTVCGRCADVCPTEAACVFGEVWDIDRLFDHVMQDAPFFKNGNGGVTFSGGECLMQADFAVALAKRFFNAGISVDIDTCGYVPRSVFESILPYTDAFLYDIKAIDPTVHRLCTGRDNAIILDNLKYLSENGAKLEIRIPLVAGYNDTECDRIATFLSGLPNTPKVKLLRYHDYARSRYQALSIKDTLPLTQTTPHHLTTAQSTFMSHNINDED